MFTSWTRASAEFADAMRRASALPCAKRWPMDSAPCWNKPRRTVGRASPASGTRSIISSPSPKAAPRTADKISACCVSGVTASEAVSKRGYAPRRGAKERSPPPAKEILPCAGRNPGPVHVDSALRGPLMRPCASISKQLIQHLLQRRPVLFEKSHGSRLRDQSAPIPRMERRTPAPPSVGHSVGATPSDNLGFCFVKAARSRSICSSLKIRRSFPASTSPLRVALRKQSERVRNHGHRSHG